jgi:hypothetical protein
LPDLAYALEVLKPLALATLLLALLLLDRRDPPSFA